MYKLNKNISIILAAFMLMLLLCSQTKAADFLCLHYKNDPLTPITCQFLADKFGFTSNLYKNYAGKKHTVIWLAGFGTPDGFWTNSEGKYRVPWSTIVKKYKADVLIVEACYSGQVFRYNVPKGMTVITSTNEFSASTNTPEKWSNWDYLPTLASMLYCCIYKDEACKKYIGCYGPDFDPQVCQMSMFFHNCKRKGHGDGLLDMVQMHPDYHPNFSIGTVMINGKPWRQIK